MKRIITIAAIGILFGFGTTGLLADESAETETATPAGTSRQEARPGRRNRKEHLTPEQLTEKRAEIEAEIKAKREEIDRKRAEQLAKDLEAAKTEEEKKAIQARYDAETAKLAEMRKKRDELRAERIGSGRIPGRDGSKNGFRNGMKDGMKYGRRRGLRKGLKNGAKKQTQE